MQITPNIPQVAFGGKGKKAGVLASLAATAAMLSACGSTGTKDASELTRDGFERCNSSNINVEQKKIHWNGDAAQTWIKACKDQTVLFFNSGGEYVIADTPDVTNVEVDGKTLTADYRGKHIEIDASKVRNKDLPDSDPTKWVNQYTITDSETGENISSNANGVDSRQSE